MISIDVTGTNSTKKALEFLLFSTNDITVIDKSIFII